jgi:hypothetical protein
MTGIHVCITSLYNASRIFLNSILRQIVIREWAVLAIRNLCEDSDAIQQEISKLSPTGVENTPELNEMQVNVTLDPETGRVRIGQKQADSAT